MSDATKKILSNAVKPSFADAFDGYDGPMVMPEDELFYSMKLDGITSEAMDECDYFVEADYPRGILKRYAVYLGKVELS